jgi:hypothetical protein
MPKDISNSNMVYGKDKVVKLSEWSERHETKLEEKIQLSKGVMFNIEHDVLDLHGLRSKVHTAQHDTTLKDATVKVGVIGTDLYWLARNFHDEHGKEYEHVLIKGYTTKDYHPPMPVKIGITGSDHGMANAQTEWEKYQLTVKDRAEAEKVLSAAADKAWLVRASSGHLTASRRDGVKFTHLDLTKTISEGKKPVDKKYDVSLALTKAKLKQIKEWLVTLKAIQDMDGYYADLDSSGAETKLNAAPLGSWLVRKSSQLGQAAYSRKVAGDKIIHERIANKAQYDLFIKYTRSSGRLMQVKD